MLFFVKFEEEKMRKFWMLVLPLAMLLVTGIGCSNTDELNKEAAKELDKIGDLNIEMPETDAAKKALEGVPGLDLAKLKEQFQGITEGISNLTAENANAVVEKISSLTSSLGEMGLEKLDAAKLGMLKPVINAFKTTVNEKMATISDESVLGKIKPAVNAMMEKLNSIGL